MAVSKTARLSRRTALMATGAFALAGAARAQAAAPSRADVQAAMRRATTFMVDKVAYRGGYVWSYLPDFSRRWGELEAKPTMVWIQPPGTATMGHAFLDALHITGDDYYYRAAEQVAGALVAGQTPEGGWNYLIDFAGPASLQDWYDTYGANAWRMEEFQHNWNNATFDDAGTSESMQFLLRLYAERRDRKWKPALDKAIDFVLQSQYPVGGWPQRWPVHPGKGGKADYTGLITFNDDVAGENIKFLIMVYQALGERRVLEPIGRAMDVFLVTQQPAPQAGWGLQHGLDLKPAAARTYEPKALTTHTTANNLDQLMTFYELTGDPKYLARVPEGIAWLDSVKLPAPIKGRSHPTFIEIGTNQPLYVHRRGSNVVNGQYYVDKDPARTLAHYSSFRNVDTHALRARYEKLKATPPDQASARSPLKQPTPLPRLFANRDINTSDLNSTAGPKALSPAEVSALMGQLNAEGWWPSKLRSTSNPYKGPGPKTPTPGDYAVTHVGDAWDTSPYPIDDGGTVISVAAYIHNMSALGDYLDRTKG